MSFISGFGVFIIALLLAIPWFSIVLLPIFLVTIGLLIVISGVWVKDKKPRKNALLVDDDPSSLQVIEKYLKGIQYDYEIIDNPQKAALKLYHGGYDLVIMDNDMAELSGSQILAQADKMIEGDTRHFSPMHSRVIPVIGYTGVANAKWNISPLIHYEFLSSISKRTPPSLLKQEMDKVISHAK